MTRSICRFLTVMPACVLALAMGGVLPSSIDLQIAAQDIAAQDIAAPNEDAAEETEEVVASTDDILEWIDQLDADRASERKAAEKSLIAAGVAALEYLPENPDGFSIEAVERLARVKAALVALKAESQSAAIRIRLGEAKTLGEALEIISRESQIEFEHSADESLAIQTPQAPLSFWHAVDVVLDQADLDVNHYGGDQNTLQLVDRGEDRQSRVDSAAYSGVYRIEPMSVNSRRVFNQPSQSGLNISMQITWQPGLTPIGLSIPVAELNGKLDNGNNIEPQSTENNIDIVANAELAFSEFFLPLELPRDSPKGIESLRGTIESLLPGKKHDFEFPLTEPGAEQTIDAVTVRLEQVRPNGDLYEVRIAVDLDDADRALESHRQWIFQNPIFVRSKDGLKQIEDLGSELYRQTESSVGIGYLFDIDDLSNAILVYQSPTSVSRNQVEFLLQDIKLP